MIVRYQVRTPGPIGDLTAALFGDAPTARKAADDTDLAFWFVCFATACEALRPTRRDTRGRTLPNVRR
jgi:hypothetical protein